MRAFGSDSSRGTSPASPQIPGWTHVGLFLGVTVSVLLPFHFAPWRTFQNDLAAFAAWALLLATNARQGDAPRGTHPAALLIWVLPVLPWFWPWGGDGFLSDRALASLYLGAAVLVFDAGRRAVKEGRDSLVTDTLLAGLVLGALLNVGVQALQYFGLPPYGLLTAESAPFGRASGNVGQANHLATLQVLASLGVLGWWAERRIAGWVAGFALAVLLSGMALTQSRVGALAVLLVGAVLALRPRTWGPRRGVILAGVSWLALCWWVALRGGEWAGLEGTAADRLSSVSLASRAIHWTNLWLAISERAGEGWGWAQVGAAQLWAMRDGLAGQEMIEHAHNIFLDLLVWCGMGVGGVLCLGLAYVAWTMMMRVRDPSTSPKTWFAALSVLVVLLHAQLEYPLDYAYLLLPVAWLCGVAFAGSGSPTRAYAGNWPGIAARSASLWTLALCAVLGAWVLFEYPKVANDFIEMRYETAGLLPPKWRQAPDVVLLDGPREYIRLARMPPGVRPRAEEIEWARRVSARFPTPAALAQYAQSQRSAGSMPQAKLTLWRLCKMYDTGICAQMLADFSQPQRTPEKAAVPL